MTAPLICVGEMLIEECGTMSKQRIHHLPVVAAEGNVVGMISATDFLDRPKRWDAAATGHAR